MVACFVKQNWFFWFRFSLRPICPFSLSCAGQGSNRVQEDRFAWTSERSEVQPCFAAEAGKIAESFGSAVVVGRGFHCQGFQFRD